MDLHDIPLTVQRRWLRYITRTWHCANNDYLGGQLRPPQFELGRSERWLGQWTANTRTLSIAIDHIATADTWLDVALTVRHEMAHQVVSEVFNASNAEPHGELFRRACRMLAVDSSPRAEVNASAESKRVRDRIQKLLRLAGSDNPHEAQSAMAAANRLLLRHNLERVDAEDKGANGREGYSWRWVGSPTGRVTLERKLASMILADFFFVECIWIGTWSPAGKKLSVLEIIGANHNLELAEYAHDYLTRTLDTLWAIYRGANPGGGNARRNEYRAGVLMGFRQHLTAEREACQTEGLIWLGDPALSEFYDRRHPRRSRLSRSRYRIGDAHQAGLADGRQIRIRGGVGKGQAPGGGGRLLPGQR